jgi:hypothetical protein
MSDSRRQQIVDAIETRLGQIAPGKVYQLPDGPYTCGSSIKGVYPWRKAAFGKTEVPAIRFTDDNADVNPGPSTQHENKLQITLEGFVLGSTSASAARSLMADVVACIGSDPRWGVLAYWTDLHSHAIDVEQSGDVIAGVQINFNVTYRTPLWRM